LKTLIDLSIIPTDETAMEKVGDYRHSVNLPAARALITRGLTKRDDIMLFSEKIAQIANETKKITKIRDFILEPIKTIKAQVESMRKEKSSLFDPALNELADVRAKLEAIYNPFMDRVRREDEAAAIKKHNDEIAAAEEATRNANSSDDFMAVVAAEEKLSVAVDKPLAKPLTRVKTMEGCTYNIEVQRLEVVDISKVPAKYLLPDEAGMMIDFKAGRVNEIPGVRFFKETQTRVR
jgi:hypothetical protein